MPQIAQFTEQGWYFASQLFWVLLSFGLLYFVVGRSMFPKVQSTIDARDRRIADDLGAARTAHAEADAVEADYRARSDAARAEAQAAISDAKARAQAATSRTTAEADVDNASRLAEAERAIASARTSALAEIEHVAADAAGDLVARLTPAPVDEATIVRAVRNVLAA